MKQFLSAVLVVCLCMFFGPALYSEELPDEGMDPNYEPENVVVPDENLNEDTVPVNESEIEEANTLEDDQTREDADYNTFENRMNEIQSDEKTPIE